MASDQDIDHLIKNGFTESEINEIIEREAEVRRAMKNVIEARRKRDRIILKEKIARGEAMIIDNRELANNAGKPLDVTDILKRTSSGKPKSEGNPFSE